MRRQFLIAILSGAAAMLTMPAPAEAQVPELSSAQLRELQTRFNEVRPRAISLDCSKRRIGFAELELIAQEIRRAATTAVDRDLARAAESEVESLRNYALDCGQKRPPLASNNYPGLRPSDLVAIAATQAGADVDVVDKDLVDLEGLRLAGICDAVRTEIERLRGLPLSYDQADELERIAERPCPPTSSQPASRPDDLELSLPVGFGFQASPALGGFFGVGEVHLPQTGIGFMRDGPPGEAPEEQAGTTPDDVDFVSIEGIFQFIVEGMPVRITLGYAEGDAANRFEVPGDAGIDSGRVNGAPAPSGSSGIATPFGLSGGTAVDHARYRSMFDLGVYSGGSWRASWQDQQEPTLAPGYGASVWFGYGRLERDYTAFASYSGGGPPFVFEFSQDREQTVTDDIFGAGLRAAAAIPIGGGVVGRLTGSAGGYYIDSSLESTERNLCNFCPPEDQDFTIAIEDSNSGFGFQSEAGAGLEFALSPRVSLIFDVSAEYWSRIGAIFNPSSGDQVFFDGLTTELRTQDMWSWRVGGGIVVRLGRPGS